MTVVVVSTGAMFLIIMLLAFIAFPGLKKAAAALVACAVLFCIGVLVLDEIVKRNRTVKQPAVVLETYGPVYSNVEPDRPIPEIIRPARSYK